MLVGYVVCKSTIATKFLILYVYNHKTSRSRIPRPIILYIQDLNRCVATNCSSGYTTGDKKPSFLFPEDEELCKKWIYFSNRKNCAPTKYSVVCIVRLHDKFIKHGKSWCKLNWELYPVPTIHRRVNSQPSPLNASKVPRRSPEKKSIARIRWIWGFHKPR